jgi:hypothetical protein
MANPKLYGEFRSDYGNFYLIEIWDEDYTGNDPDRFNVTSNGFELNYSGQTDNIYSPVIGSSVSFGMYIKDAATRAFETDFKNYQENRYYVKIWKGNFNGQDADKWYNTSKVSDDGLVMNFSPDEEELVYLDFFWGGYILQDVVKIEDAAEPYVLQIEANDGIAKLKNVDALRFRSSITSIFSNAIFSTYSHSIFPTEWPALKVISNWWSEQQTYSASDNPLDSTAVDVDVFHEFDADGNIRKASYYDVLTNVCKAFGMRFYFSNGSYRAEQVFQRDISAFTEFSYKTNGNLIGYESVTRDKTLDQTSNKARLAGNIFNFLPAVNKTQITTDEGDVNYAGIISNQTTQPTIDLGFTTDDPQNWLEINFKSEVELEINTNVNNIRIYYIINVDVVLDDGTTTYYLKRNHIGLTPNNASWTTTQAGSGYEVIVGPFIEQVQSPYSPPYSEFHSASFTVITPTLPQEGDITVEFNGNKWINKSGVTRTLNASNNSYWDSRVISIDKMNGNNGHFVEARVTNSNIGSGLVYDLGTTKIFDGSGNRGSLYYQNGLVYTLTTGWREGNSGSYITAQRLIANEFLALMNKPIQKYEGSIFSSHHFMTRLIFEGKNWLQLGGRFIANSDEWDGEWFAISKETITITNTDTGVPADPVFSIGSGSLDGRSSLSATNITDLGAVDVEVENDVTVGNDLGVTGNSTLSTTSVGEFTTTDRVNVTLNEITGNPGGSETLLLRNHFNFISYSGANGTYTINLPAAEDGVILRFKTDDTVLANKTITLTPQSGQRIDAESSYIMDRSYDGITLLGKDSNWYIIQKKEK